jgi:hypothetical protein
MSDKNEYLLDNFGHIPNIDMNNVIVVAPRRIGKLPLMKAENEKLSSHVTLSIKQNTENKNSNQEERRIQIASAPRED